MQLSVIMNGNNPIGALEHCIGESSDWQCELYIADITRIITTACSCMCAKETWPDFFGVMPANTTISESVNYAPTELSI